MLWQNRHCQGQPRMISMAIRSCAVSTNGTIGRVGSGVPSRSPITHGRMASGTSSREPPDLDDRAVLAVDRLVEPRDIGPAHAARRSGPASPRATGPSPCSSRHRSQTTGRLGSPSPITNRSMKGASSSGFCPPGPPAITSVSSRPDPRRGAGSRPGQASSARWCSRSRTGARTR